MTIAEIKRRIDSYNRTKKNQLKEEANFVYQQSILIGIAVGKLFDKSTTFPTIEEIFPSLFETPEAKEEKQDLLTDISVKRFLLFKEKNNAMFNNKNKEGGNGQ